MKYKIIEVDKTILAYFHGIIMILLLIPLMFLLHYHMTTMTTTTPSSIAAYAANGLANRSSSSSTITATDRPIEVKANATTAIVGVQSTKPVLQEFPVSSGSHPHDVAPAPDGTVWYTAQQSGELGRLDPTTGKTHHIALGQGSAPHGVIVGPDGAPWITDGGLNAIVRVDPTTEKVKIFPLPKDTGYVNLNTATFDHNGVIWFTGQSGVYV